MGDSSLKRKETGIKDCYKRTQIKDKKRTKGYLDTFGVRCHLGGELDKSGLPTPFDIETETKGPEEIHSQTRTVSILDSRYNWNSLSACVPHSPWNKYHHPTQDEPCHIKIESSNNYDY